MKKKTKTISAPHIPKKCLNSEGEEINHPIFEKVKTLLQDNGVNLPLSPSIERFTSDKRYNLDKAWWQDNNLYNQVIRPLNKCDLWSAGEGKMMKRYSDIIEKENKKKPIDKQVHNGVKDQLPGKKDPYLRPSIQKIYKFIKENSDGKSHPEIINIILEVLITAEFKKFTEDDYNRVKRLLN